MLIQLRIQSSTETKHFIDLLRLPLTILMPESIVWIAENNIKIGCSKWTIVHMLTFYEAAMIIKSFSLINSTAAEHFVQSLSHLDSRAK